MTRYIIVCPASELLFKDLKKMGRVPSSSLVTANLLTMASVGHYFTHLSRRVQITAHAESFVNSLVWYL